MIEKILAIIPWIAVVALPVGYWKQVWHIYKHKETRDLDLGAFVLFLIAYISLAIEAYAIASKVFLWKNVLVIIPTLVIIIQIIHYKNSTWKDDDEYEKFKDNAEKNRKLNKNINIKGRKEDEDSKKD